MKQFNILRRIDLRRIILVFPIIACLHELEEWNVLSWHRRFNTNVPAEVTDADLHLIFILISVFFLIWTLVSLIPKSKKATVYIFLPLMAVSFVNGLEHLIWSIEFRTYAPGLIFGFFFEMPLLIYIAYRILIEKLAAKWYLAVFSVLTVFGIVSLLMLGRELDPIIRSAMNLSKVLSGWLR